MAGEKLLEQEITTYLKQLSIEQKEIVLRVVKSFALEEEGRWDSEAFILEMNHRLKELENDSSVGVSLQLLEDEARNHYRNMKRKKK